MTTGLSLKSGSGKASHSSNATSQRGMYSFASVPPLAPCGNSATIAHDLQAEPDHPLLRRMVMPPHLAGTLAGGHLPAL
eukprot:CAMPEP_0180553150 /NCGR_PEP_ID=MMETSP1036_2-20121128/74131_1 /TAXON_ID=632150 /ORGANISM="Azadinium spinosum, Strain 3D9" /LENGTH=78 /DNA_ID=CAMNT_0022568663 /DNA_START=81 /DNA_END=314 /DNA_ORIENTATION=-